MGGAFSDVGRASKALVEDAIVLVGLDAYRDALVQCVSEPYNEDALAYFLAFDNVICRDLRSLVGVEATATLWEARARVFAEVEPPSSLDPSLGKSRAFVEDQAILWKTLLGGTTRTSSDKLWELFEMRLK